MPAGQGLQRRCRRLVEIELPLSIARRVVARRCRAVDAEPGWRGKAAQPAAPERLGCDEILMPQPGDVVPIRAGMGERGLLPSRVRMVCDKDLIQNKRNRPAI